MLVGKETFGKQTNTHRERVELSECSELVYANGTFVFFCEKEDIGLNSQSIHFASDSRAHWLVTSTATWKKYYLQVVELSLHVRQI